MKSVLLISTIVLFLFTACTDKKAGNHQLYNETATLPDELLQDINQWKVITTLYDRAHKTMSVLYGNTTAVSAARKGIVNTYPPASALCLVTWNQQEDAHWFGGRIASNAQRVEWVRFNATDARPVYEQYEGKPLQKNTTGDTAFINERIHFITSRKVLVIP